MRFNKSDAILLLFFFQFLVLLPLYGASDSVVGPKAIDEEMDADFTGSKPVVAVDRKGGGRGGGGRSGGGGRGHARGSGNQVYRGPYIVPHHHPNHSNQGNLSTPVDSPILILLLILIVHLFDVLDG